MAWRCNSLVSQIDKLPRFSSIAGIKVLGISGLENSVGGAVELPTSG